MSQLKCVACKIRLRHAAGPRYPVDDVCPECGSALEPVGALADVMGFRLVDGDGSAPATDQLLAAEAVAVAMPRPETTV
jgi:hypothetical protein